METKKELAEVTSDTVYHPNHYTMGGIETLDFIQAKLTSDEFDGYLVGNIIKYISRYKYKNGVEDLRKAHNYLDILIQTKGVI